MASSKRKKTAAATAPRVANLIFRRALKSYVTLKKHDKELQLALAEVKSTLLQCVMEAPEGKITTPTHVVQHIEISRKTLVKDKLIELGVSMRQIERSTKVTSVVYVKVTEKNQAG